MVVIEAVMLTQWPMFGSVVWIRSGPIRIFPLNLFLLIMRVGLLPILEAIRCKPWWGGGCWVAVLSCMKKGALHGEAEMRERGLMAMESTDSDVPLPRLVQV